MNIAFKWFVAAHVWLYRKTNGRLGRTVKGKPVMLLTTIGRKTGKERTVPVMHVEDGEGHPLVVGSLGGAPKPPLWFENLRHNPLVTYQIGGRVVRARAEVVNDEERARLWPILTAAWPDFLKYEKRTTRVLPVAVLKPLS